MAFKAKALYGFSKMKDDELMVIANTIVGAMTNNSNFTNPTPDLADLQLVLDDFASKLVAARKRGSPEDTAIKDEARIPLTDVLRQLANYVNGVARGQLSTVLSSGFPTNAPATISQVPLAVEGVKLRDGRQSGQARLDFASQAKVLLYEYTYRKVAVPEEEWSDRLTTTSSQINIIAPLEVGVIYEVRVRAVNSKGAGDWSQTARLMVR